ncbi:MAG TPA: ribosome recycling factor [Elusimicrobia bacterium]|nr:MAG: ribosome recycling factor [Elusimicrobia bacterium RIFOXYA12_FULL_49_49]OGS10247.1 MAG: ribosome recycling factor [Elusimicrobia bacterium RIFOXYA1_FULL_47_7]OGS11256.1 MAG: ribosome recycling factor [Elusimicrobia bacterium RIFOXYB1_FULL_48_9]OGS15664.1 MAG: ribosome recycling factor [Elusimicrobia bacterium RIFOXYA2_FULL_47_53]OGS26913.1 MAG: ribosome recycling factor [Elusimicrobia bacterium RIFOXYB12_FULL_50_12]OGS30763.1 MAG: ribosome recycling factor [Elusimicrobia bacterium RIFO
MSQIIANGEEPMKKTLEKMKNDLSAIRTGRASVALIDGLRVDSYGSLLPIKQLANLSVSDARTIEVRPWDISQLQSIEKAIQKSDLGLTPVNDGKIIRLSVPQLNEERRKELIKVVNKMTEDFRVSIRNERRVMVEALKKAEKDKKITEDDRKKGEGELQKITDIYVKKIDEMLKAKEKDIMEV